MQRVLSWIALPFFLAVFIGVLLVFHPLLVIANLVSAKAFRKVFHLMNWSVLASLKVSGTSFEISFEESLPKNQPLIVASNHQSMFDIPFLIWTFRDHNPVFISKKELGRWIPTISFSLRHMGSTLIDRNDPKQAVGAIGEFGKSLSARKQAGFIFPEGTRARDGVKNPFKKKGLKTLLENAPDAMLVPVVIDNSWKLVSHGLFPVPWGTHLTLRVLKPVARAGKDADTLVGECEAFIDKTLTEGA